MAMIFYVQPTDPWEEFDFKLLEAYQILQDETCNMCGQPIWICRSTSSNIRIKVRKTQCNVTAELEKKQKSDEKAKRELKPGEYYYTAVETYDGGYLPTRQEFYEEQAQAK
jgi:hypothetical protein